MLRIDFEKAKALNKLHLLKKYRETKEGIAFELYDVQSALVDILKIHGMFTEKVENTHKFDGIVGIDVHVADDDA